MARTAGGFRLKYVHTSTSKGKIYHFYRRNGIRQRIKGDPNSYEFLSHYNDIHASFEDPGNAPVALGTFARLIEEFTQSPEFKNLADKSRSEYKRYLAMIQKPLGDHPVAELTTPQVYMIRDKLSETPRKADYLISVLKKILGFSVKRGYRKENPAAGVEKISKPKSYIPWEDFQIQAFRSQWGIDTMQRVAFELALNTGQRGGDIIDMTRSDYNDGWISVQQNKTGQKLEIPVSAALAEVLDPWLVKHKHIMLVTNANGAQFKKNNFEHVMRRAYNACGFNLDLSTHGLRYTAATVMREIGVTRDDIAAITGHQTEQMLHKYTRQKRRAERAITVLDGNKI